MSESNRPADGMQPTRGMPRVFPIASLQPRANSPTSRSARVVTSESTGTSRLFAGMFWSDPGSDGGWAFGDADPKVDGAPHIGVGEEVYLCLRGRIEVEWEGGTFEFGAGDIVYFPNDRWYRARTIGGEPAQVFYVVTPPPTSIWPLGQHVTVTGEPVEEESRPATPRVSGE